MNNTPNGVEQSQQAEARVIDAASWITKSSAQLLICNNESSNEAGEELIKLARDLLQRRAAYAALGANDAKLSPHATMTTHALLSASAHALYADETDCADSLLKMAMERLR